MDILRAKPTDSAALTAIAFAAKRHWGYAEKWIENWRDVLTIQPEFIARHETYIALVGAQRLGFYAFCCENGRVDLEHLWVLPDAMGQSVGRSLFHHAVERARELGFREMQIESDPNAEKFYRHMGARRIG